MYEKEEESKSEEMGRGISNLLQSRLLICFILIGLLVVYLTFSPLSQQVEFADIFYFVVLIHTTYIDS